MVWRARGQEEAGQWLLSGCSVGGQDGQVVSGVLAVGGQWVVRRARDQQDEAVFKTMLIY